MPRVMLNDVKHLAKCPGEVRTNERNVTCHNFSVSAAELNGNIKSLREILPVVRMTRNVIWLTTILFFITFNACYASLEDRRRLGNKVRWL